MTLVRAKGLRLWEEVLPEEVEAKRSDDRYEVRTFVPESFLNAALAERDMHRRNNEDLREQLADAKLDKRLALARAEEAEKKHQWAHEQRARAETAREEAERERDDARTQYGNLLRAGEDQDRAFENALAIIERVREECERRAANEDTSDPNVDAATRHHRYGRQRAFQEVLSLLNPKASEHGPQDG